MDFTQAFDRLINHEGGYVNNPLDPGGETNWGISKRSYPLINIATLTREGAKAIYKRDFWDRIHGDTLAPGVAFQVFDFAVNSGIETSVRYLQRALGVADDGFWGPVSQSAANSSSPSTLIMSLNAERLDYMTRLSAWPAFGKGWARRIANNLRYGTQDS